MRNWLAICALLAFTAPAMAEWVHIADEDAFSDDVTHIALGAVGKYAVGFRCINSEDLTLVYLTPEGIDQEALDTLAPTSPKLLIRVDSSPVVTLATTFNLTADGDLGASARGDQLVDLAKAMGVATKRIAVAIDVLGQRMHVQDIDTRGSTKAINDLLSGCKIN